MVEGGEEETMEDEEDESGCLGRARGVEEKLGDGEADEGVGGDREKLDDEEADEGGGEDEVAKEKEEDEDETVGVRKDCVGDAELTEGKMKGGREERTGEGDCVGECGRCLFEAGSTGCEV